MVRTGRLKTDDGRHIGEISVKTRIIIFLILMFIPALVLGKLSTKTERLEMGGIVTKIDMPPESKFAYVSVWALIDAKPGVVWNTLKDIDNWPNWLPMNEKAFFVSAEAEKLITVQIARVRTKVEEINTQHPPDEDTPSPDGKWKRMAYESYNMPWPLKNEWVIRHYSFDETENPFVATWRKVAADDDKDDGFWKVKGWTDDKHTHLEYYYRVKRKEGVPDVLFSGAIKLTVNSMIKSLRREAKKRTGATS